MDLCLQQRQIPPAVLACMPERACGQASVLSRRARCDVFGDLARSFAVPAAELQRALWELVAAGLVTADGFDSLRILIDPRRKSASRRSAKAGSHAAGRWGLLCGDALAATPAQREAQLESACTVLLRRYGVVFRDLLAREETMPRWRDLLGIFRRMEARGEVRGGRFRFGFWRRAVCVAGGSRVAAGDAAEAGFERHGHCCGGRSDEPGWYRGSGRAGGCGAGKDRYIRQRSRGG